MDTELSYADRFLKRCKKLKTCWEPKPYQVEACKFLLNGGVNGGAGLLLDPGMGKTSITLAALKALKESGASKKALVIAPLRPLTSAWAGEIGKWDTFSSLTYAVLHGKDKAKELEKDVDVYLINFDGLKWLFEDKGREKRILSIVDTLVIDEISSVKNTSSIRHKLLKSRQSKFKRKWGLTGSPAANGLEDLFGQCVILDMGACLGKYKTHFAKLYYDYSPYTYGYTIKPGADKLIYKAIEPLFLRLDSKDHLELPEIVNVTLEVVMSDAEMEAYTKLEKRMLTEIDEVDLVATNATSILGKCSQLANGAMYHGGNVDAVTGEYIEREVLELHEEKLKSSVQLATELLGNPTLWGYHYKHDLDRLEKAFTEADIPYRVLGGDRDNFDTVIKEWNAGLIQNLFCQSTSAALGLNLQGASARHLVFFSIVWDYQVYHQFICRLVRQGSQAKSVMVYHLVTQNTVDELKMEALGSKQRCQDTLLHTLKEYRRVKYGEEAI